MCAENVDRIDDRIAGSARLFGLIRRNPQRIQTEGGLARRLTFHRLRLRGRNCQLATAHQLITSGFAAFDQHQILPGAQSHVIRDTDRREHKAHRGCEVAANGGDLLQ